MSSRVSSSRGFEASEEGEDTFVVDVDDVGEVLGVRGATPRQAKGEAGRQPSDEGISKEKRWRRVSGPRADGRRVVRS